MSFSKPTVLRPYFSSHSSEILLRALSPQNGFRHTRLPSLSAEPTTTTLIAKIRSQFPSAPNSSPSPRLFALIIATNTYQCPEVLNLRGPEPDAHLLKAYLLNNLQVPESQITLLLNRNASRKNIVEAFQNLEKDPRIKEGDPIVIFYAGHGAELEYDGSRIQAIIPQDYFPSSVSVIPDHVLGRLIERIAKEKGNNITVIFDCCNAGSGTRGIKEPRVARGTDTLTRSVVLDQSAYDPKVDRDILYDGTRGSTFCTKFRHGGLNSHIFIAACGSSEEAKESNGHGHFSSAFFKLLRTISPDKLRYCDILTHMDHISGQNPQCEGLNKDRSLFDGKVLPRHRQFYPIIERKARGTAQPQFVLEAGSAQGITVGAKFTVFSPNKTADRPSVTVTSVEAFTAVLKIPRGTVIWPSSVAMQTRTGQREDLRLFVPPQDEFRDMYKSLCDSDYHKSHDLGSTILVDSPDLAHLKVSWRNSWVTFSIIDERATNHGFKHQFEVFADLNSVATVLRKAAHFYRKLNHETSDSDVNGLIKIEFYELQEAGVDECGNQLRTPIGPNLYQNQTVNVVVEEDTPYGIRIVNNSKHDFYPYLYFFDNSDLSILSHWETQPMPYSPDFTLERNGGSFTVGYGSGGVPPLSYYLQHDEQDVDVGFLKLILSTKAVDLSRIPQKSPFVNTRRSVPWTHPFGENMFTLDGHPHTWHTMLIPVIQRRSSANG